MNIREYKTQVQRTLPDLGSKILNSIHMTLGMGSEFLEEAIKGVEKEDKVNIAEELADVQWYACNYATIHGIDITEELVLSILKDGEEILFKGLQAIGKLQDIDKKELAYGKVIPSDDPQRINALYVVFQMIEAIANEFEIDMNEAREKVINKLKLRYPDKFDSDKAINRDVVAERKILEGGNEKS